MRNMTSTLCLLVSIAAVVPPASAQSNPRLQTFFEQNIGLSQDQIDDSGTFIQVTDALKRHRREWQSSGPRCRPGRRHARWRGNRGSGREQRK